MLWMQSTDSPFVVLAEPLLSNWSGIDGGYDRACEIEDWLGVIKLEGKEVLVVADEPMQTTALPLSDAYLLIRWNCTLNEKSVERHLVIVNQLDFPGPGILVDFGDRDLALMDFSSIGNQSEKIKRSCDLSANHPDVMSEHSIGGRIAIHS